MRASAVTTFYILLLYDRFTYYDFHIVVWRLDESQKPYSQRAAARQYIFFSFFSSSLILFKRISSIVTLQKDKQKNLLDYNFTLRRG